jgi:hypothetical protein
MNRSLLVLLCLLIGSLVSGDERPPKPAKDEPVMVVIELCEVEVDVVKLREMGIDWEKASHHESIAGNPAWFKKWAELLLENGVLVRHSNPKLATIANREAVFDVGDLRETVKARMVDRKIEVAVTLDNFDMVPLKGGAWTRGDHRASYSTVAQFKPGETKLLRHVPATKKDSDGKVTGETATLTFLTVDLVRPETEQAQRQKKPTDSELRAGPVIVGARPLGSAVEKRAKDAAKVKDPGVVEIKEAAPPRKR